MRTTTAIITMAGRGVRFRQAGYQCPKYEISVRGRTLFAWSMESLRSFIDQAAEFIFVARREDAAAAFVEQESRRVGIRAHQLLELDETTDGQATTALLAGSLLRDQQSPVLIYNIDTYVDPAHLPASRVRGDGWIPCFPGEGSAWSFARADDSGRILEVREKTRISDDATIGLYWFSSFACYRELYESLYSGSRSPEAGERYIAPMYNDMIATGQAVYIHRLPREAVTPLGTPADVDRFAGGPDAD